MKKTTSFILVLILFACFSTFATPVDLNKAKLAGKNFYFERLTSHTSQAIAYSDLKISSEYVEKAGDIPVYYVFNFSGNGFIIISADDCCLPVIGYSFDSHASTENQSDNFVYWMNCRKQEIVENIQRNVLPDTEISGEWSRLSNFNPQLPIDSHSG